MSLSIKELFYSNRIIDMSDEEISILRNKKESLSNSEKKFLLSIIREFKTKDINEILSAIKIYSIWNPNESIYESRKKGVFRYRSYRFDDNKSLLLIEELLQSKEIFLYSKETVEYLQSKQNLSWLYNFYKKSEQKIIKIINKSHKERKIINKENRIIETALFKDLLVYIDYHFSKDFSIFNNNLNKNDLKSYSKEDLSEAISYIIYLYDKTIGIKQDAMYISDYDNVFSKDIEDLILIACKLNQVEAWELHIDYFDYKVKLIDKSWVIYSENEKLDKSIKMGYIKNQMQSLSFNISLNDKLKEVPSIEEHIDQIVSTSELEILEEINDGILSRYRLKVNELILKYFSYNTIDRPYLFKEEIVLLEYFSKELMMTSQELSRKQITKYCTLKDILLFKRFFLISDYLTSKLIIQNTNLKKVSQSLIPLFDKDSLKKTLSLFVDSELKINELLDLFIYNNNNNFKLDLQYTPLLNVSRGVICSTNIVSKSNLLRNSIAYSYLSKNQIVNQDDLEPLVNTCCDIFKKCSAGYDVHSNLKFKYLKQEGEIDVLVISDSHIFLIECKSPLYPGNSFEMRSSLQHIEKANKQLNHCKKAFNDKSFRKKYLKGLKIEDKNQEIITCIVFGNRLFSGFDKYQHPIRYVYELDTILNEGIVTSKILNAEVSTSTLGKWRVWSSKTFSNEDLINFLSEDKSLININFNAMNKIDETIYADNNKIILKTHCYDIMKVSELYDSQYTSI